MSDVPKMTLSMTAVERARLERLAARWGVKPSRAVALAVTHATETLDQNQTFHTVVTGEEQENQRDPTS